MHFMEMYTVQPTFLNVNCSAESDGQYVVVTCLSVGTTEQITSIEYSINGGTTRRGEGLRVIKLWLAIQTSPSFSNTHSYISFKY